MHLQIDRARLKSMARILQTAVAETPKQRFRYTQALDATARALGFADYNTAEARLPETAEASPTGSQAQQPASLGQQAFVLQTTHDYDTDTVVCTGFETVVGQLDQILSELNTDDAPEDAHEAARTLINEGWLEIDGTRIDLVTAPVAPAPARALETSTLEALRRMTDLLRTVPRHKLPPVIAADWPEMTAALRQAVRDLAARTPEARSLLEWQVSTLHPAPWRLVRDGGTPRRLVDATGQAVEELGAGDEDRAQALVAAVAAYAAEIGGDLPEGCREIIDAFLAAGGSHDDLWALINSDACPDGAEDASGELEINGIEGGFGVIVDVLGVFGTAQWLIDVRRNDRERWAHLDFERLVDPAVQRLIGRGLAAFADHDALWHALIDHVDDAVSHLAADAANAATSEAEAEAAIEATWKTASDVNNQDVPGQLRFLIQEHGSIDAVARLLPDVEES